VVTGIVAVGAASALALLIWPDRPRVTGVPGVRRYGSASVQREGAVGRRGHWRADGGFARRGGVGRPSSGVRLARPRVSRWPARFWALWIFRALTGVVAAAVAVAASVPVAPIVAAVLIVATVLRLVRRARAAGRERADLNGAAVILRALTRELRAGRAPVDALQAVLRDAPERVARIVEPLGGGSSRGSTRVPRGAAGWPAAPTAGTAKTGRVPRESVGVLDDVARRLHVGWDVAQRQGVPLSSVLSMLADDITDRSAAERARAAQVAGPAVSGYVLAALPIAGLLLGTGMGSDPIAVLGSTTVGGALLVVGVALSCGGLVWADRIVRGG
jgi:tight adherence protein B